MSGMAKTRWLSSPKVKPAYENRTIDEAKLFTVSLYQSMSAGEMTLTDYFGFASALGLDGADVSVAHLDSYAPSYLHSLQTVALRQSSCA